MANDQEMLDVDFPPVTAQSISMTPMHNSQSDAMESDKENTSWSNTFHQDRYDEYDTIDWVKDLSADSCRKRQLQQKAQFSLWGRIQLIWDSSSGWLCVGLIGALIGLLAAVIDIGVGWFSDLKEGVCMEQLWFNREQCCWSFNTTVSMPIYPHLANKTAGATSFDSKQTAFAVPVIEYVTAGVTSLARNSSYVAVIFNKTLTNFTTHLAKDIKVTSLQTMGSGAKAAYGHYSCEQWYSWERLITGSDGDLQHLGSFIVGILAYVLCAIAMVGLCSAFVSFLAPSAAGSGIPEVKTILGGFEIQNFLGPWTLVVKTAGLMLSVSTGLCIGHDGPMVHVGACCAKLLSHLFPKYGRNGAKTRELISAAVAGGIGACFGAPIGGVLFSLEVASFYFPSKTLFRSFFCALVAAYVARAMNPFGDEHFVMFSVDHETSWHLLELIPFAVLGMTGGIFGALVIRLNKVVQNVRRTRCRNRPIVYLLILTTVFSSIIYFHPDLRVHERLFIRKLVSTCSPGDQEDLCDYIRLPPMDNFGNLTSVSESHLRSIFQAGPRMGRGIFLLVLALLFKFIGLVLVYGVPVPTGVMMPSIMVGSILGRLMGITMEQLVVTQLSSSPLFRKICKPGRPCIDPGLYAVVGAAACLGGITRTTVSLVVIMLEVIGELGYIFPIMVAAMFAKWTGDRLFFGSLYDVQIRLNEYPYLGFDKSLYKVGDSSAADIVHPKPGEGPLEMLTENTMTVGEVEELLCSSEHNGFPVVVSAISRHLVGFVSRWDLIRALDLERPPTARRYSAESIVCFTNRDPPSNLMKARITPVTRFYDAADTSDSLIDGALPIIVHAENIVDLSPTTITQHTAASTIVDMFRSLGLRQTLVTCNGQLRGIITKKDVLRYLGNLP